MFNLIGTFTALITALFTFSDVRYEVKCGLVIDDKVITGKVYYCEHSKAICKINRDNNKVVCYDKESNE